MDYRICSLTTECVLKNKYICHTINTMKLNNNNSQHDKYTLPRPPAAPPRLYRLVREALCELELPYKLVNAGKGSIAGRQQLQVLSGASPPAR